MTRIAVVCPVSAERYDGVRDYARLLAAHLGSQAPTVLVLGPHAGSIPAATSASESAGRVVCLETWRELWSRRLAERCGDPDTWIVQYVPQSLVARRGFLWLALWLWYARYIRRQCIVLTVHEFDVPWTRSIRRAGARVSLNLLMILLGAAATHLVTTYGASRAKLARLLPWKRPARLAVIPVGSTIAPAGGAAPRRREIADPQVLRCVTFGQPANMSEAVVRALGRWLGEHPGRVTFSWIGRSRREILALWVDACGLPADGLDVQEGLAPDDVSRLLMAADVFVAPLVDGVSTRRTTVMAALGHGLPIVGTDGACTDDVFRQTEACLLSPTADPAAFVANLERAAGDALRREQMAAAALALFEERFTWDHIARAYLTGVSRAARATC